MSMQVNLESELTLTPFFDFRGVGKVANLDETISPVPSPGNVFNSKLFQTDQDIKVKLEWAVEGWFAHVFDPASVWRIELLLEPMGPAEFALPGGVITLTYGSGDYNGVGPFANVSYPGAGAPNSTTITIPGGTIPEGIYDVVVALRLMHPGGATPCFLAAFGEFGKIYGYAEH